MEENKNTNTQPSQDLEQELGKMEQDFTMVQAKRVRWTYASLALVLVLGIGFGIGYVINNGGFNASDASGKKPSSSSDLGAPPTGSYHSNPESGDISCDDCGSEPAGPTASNEIGNPPAVPEHPDAPPLDCGSADDCGTADPGFVDFPPPDSDGDFPFDEGYGSQ